MNILEITIFEFVNFIKPSFWFEWQEFQFFLFNNHLFRLTDKSRMSYHMTIHHI